MCGPHGCTDTFVDDLERDLTEIQHSMPGVLRVGPSTATANRFSATLVVYLADIDSENLSDTATDPDSEPGRGATPSSKEIGSRPAAEPHNSQLRSCHTALPLTPETLTMIV